MQTKEDYRLGIGILLTSSEKRDFKDFIANHGLNQGAFLRLLILKAMKSHVFKSIENVQMQTNDFLRLSVSIPLTNEEQKEFRSFVLNLGINQGAFIRALILEAIEEEK